MSLEKLDETQITQDFFEAFPTIKLREQGSFLIIKNFFDLQQNDRHLVPLYRYLLIHPEIVKLDLSNNGFSFRASNAEIINAIFKRLSYLDLSGNRELFESDFEYLQAHPNLQYLDLSRTLDFPSSDLTCSNMRQFISKCTEIACLLMQNNWLNDEAFAKVMPMHPQQLQRLQYLNLNNNVIGKSIEAIYSLKQLRELHLIDNPAQNSILDPSFTALPELSVLELGQISQKVDAKLLLEIKVSNLSCTNNMSKEKVEALSNNPYLTSLEITPSENMHQADSTWVLAFLTNLTLRKVAIAYPRQPHSSTDRGSFLAFITDQSSAFYTPLELCLSEYLPNLGARNQQFQRDSLSTIQALLIAQIKIKAVSHIVLEFLGNVVCESEQDRRKAEYVGFIEAQRHSHSLRYDLLGQQLQCIFEALCCIGGIESLPPAPNNLAEMELIDSPTSPQDIITAYTLDFYEGILDRSSSMSSTMVEKKAFITTTILSKVRFFDHEPTEDQKRRVKEKIDHMPEDKGMPPLPEGKSSFKV